jgi:hypothetical protein
MDKSERPTFEWARCTAKADPANNLRAIAADLAAGVGTHAPGIISGTTGAVIDVFLVLGLTLLVLGDLANIQSVRLRIVPIGRRPSPSCRTSTR